MSTESTVSTDTVTAHAADEPVLKHEPPKRKKTWGEHVFNWGTYGGIALLGNEAASLAIANSVEDGGRFHGLYNKFENLFVKLRVPLTEETGVVRDYIAGHETKLLLDGKAMKPRLPYLLLATIGGMLMVPFVKYAEGHKGELVRKLDRDHYGTLTDSDPRLIEAHKEMDEAPKQSWGSLWKGRFITVVAAAVADFSFGWDYALSTKLFNSKHVSLNGISRLVSDHTAKWFNISKENAEAYKKFAFTGTWLLTLSSTLTVLFYASSKLFAKKREEKLERKQEQLSPHTPGSYTDSAEEVPAPTPLEPTSEKPTPQVRTISREETISSVPQLSQGA